MKKYIFILTVVILTMVSCTKEQPLSPVNSSEISEPQMFKTSDVVIEVFDDSSNDEGITDPEKEDKEKTNKNAKN